MQLRLHVVCVLHEKCVKGLNSLDITLIFRFHQPGNEASALLGKFGLVSLDPPEEGNHLSI